MNPRTLPIVWCAIAGMTLSATSHATVGTALFVPTVYPTPSCQFPNANASPPGNAMPMYSIIDSWDSYALGGSGQGSLHPLASYPVYFIFAGPDWTTDGTPGGSLVPSARACGRPEEVEVGECVTAIPLARVAVRLGRDRTSSPG